MKNYEKPVAMINEDMSEGVYAASGWGQSSSCWTCSGDGKQESEVSRTDWRFQINGSHINERHEADVYATFIFDTNISTADFCGYQPVELVGNKAVFRLTNYSNGVNPNENFGGGALNVTTSAAVTSLTVSVSIADGGAN